ncbi:phosphoenolpyruvate--protein phosphotransferase [Chitinispirillales bacterium ANBcel5]|uniref:phosphoenolpyruvate--protein phosphotransferase n=1 Tax=Cellulosispirillum alkaliphilum TaxID=3039283 RepID=UPI002A535FE1|nr:phosphoenolpyruvate--protein phosphotransferase [Chitinispirillales bacterium ANBcel5]
MNKGSKLTGISVVSGWGAGKAYFVGRAVQQASAVTISRQEVGNEVIRFGEIREQAKKDYRQLIEEMGDRAPLDTSILNIYEHILDDPAFIGQVVETITTRLYDLESSIRIVSDDFIKRFESAGTSYFKERCSDMVEVCEKLVSYLYQDNGRARSFIEPVVLVVLRTFTPTDILAYDKSKIEAVVTTSGGKTSHAAILARSYSIPVISGVRNLKEYIHPGDQLLVDATNSTVYIRPSASVLGKYKRSEGVEQQLAHLKKKWCRPVYTKDGVKIDVLANISLPDDVDEAVEHGADGIGLVRTEYLLSNRKEMPSEDVHYAYYKEILAKSNGKPCVIRLMDIGGDKIPQFFEMPSEFNPFMGWRAIRIFLERKDIFATQIRAILKAGEGYNYSIMVPMVTTLQEWLAAKEIIGNIAAEMGLSMPKCGVLFEVPLSILEMNTFMKEIDFASIGTNDLIQYLSAADRNNSKVNYLYNPVEPAFLRIIRSAFRTANDNGMPLSICGEMAGNPSHTALLIGLGLRKFSVMPRNIPLIKELIANISLAEASESISHIDAIETTEAMTKWLKNINKRLLGDALTKLPSTDALL